MHLFSDCSYLEPGRLASTLLFLCFQFSLLYKAEGKGLKDLGYVNRE